MRKIIKFVKDNFLDYVEDRNIESYFSITKDYRYKGHRVFNYDLFHLAYPSEDNNTDVIYFWQCSLFVEELLKFFRVKFPIQVKQQKIKFFCHLSNITKNNFFEGNTDKSTDRKITTDRFFGLIGLIVFQKFAPKYNYPDTCDLEDLGYFCFFKIADTLWKTQGDNYRLGKVDNQQVNNPEQDKKIETRSDIHILFFQFLSKNNPRIDTDIMTLYGNLEQNKARLYIVDFLFLELLKLINCQSPKLKLKSIKIKVGYKYTHEASPNYYQEIIQSYKFYELFGLLAAYMVGVYSVDARESTKFNLEHLLDVGKSCFNALIILNRGSK